MGESEGAVRGEEDDATVSAEAVVEIGDGLSGSDVGRGSGGDAVGGPFAEDELHDGFSPAGEGDGGREVVGIASAPDEGGVADTAGSFVEGAAGGGGCGKVAVDVEGDGADGVVRVEGGLGGFVIAEDVPGEGFVGESGGLAFFGRVEAFALAVEDEFGVVDEGHAVAGDEGFGVGSNEVDVRALLKDDARGLDGVAKVLDTGNAAGLHASAVHEEGIELDAAIGGEEGATTGVEGGVIFEDGDGGFDGIEGRTAAGQNGIAGGEGMLYAGEMFGFGVGGNGPCTAVHQKDGERGILLRHKNMLAKLGGEGGDDGGKVVARARKNCKRRKERESGIAEK